VQVALSTQVQEIRRPHPHAIEICVGNGEQNHVEPSKRYRCIQWLVHIQDTGVVYDGPNGLVKHDHPDRRRQANDELHVLADGNWHAWLSPPFIPAQTAPVRAACTPKCRSEDPFSRDLALPEPARCIAQRQFAVPSRIPSSRVVMRNSIDRIEANEKRLRGGKASNLLYGGQASLSGRCISTC
jgi:hypothetical protein